MKAKKIKDQSEEIKEQIQISKKFFAFAFTFAWCERTLCSITLTRIRIWNRKLFPVLCRTGGKDLGPSPCNVNMYSYEPVVDPGFPRGGRANSPGEAPTHNFAKFPPKLHEIERIWLPCEASLPPPHP